MARADLELEAVGLARLLTELMPAEAEVLSLLSLLLFTGGPAGQARADAAGDPVLLADQDRSRWDGAAVTEGVARLDGGGPTVRRGGRALPAAGPAWPPAAGTARSWADTDWNRIIGLYDLLLARAANPVVALNRAVAVTERDRPPGWRRWTPSAGWPGRTCGTPPAATRWPGWARPARRRPSPGRGGGAGADRARSEAAGSAAVAAPQVNVRAGRLESSATTLVRENGVNRPCSRWCSQGSLERATLELFDAADLPSPRSDRDYRAIDRRPAHRPGQVPAAAGDPAYVEQGLFDLGITGRDWITETAADVVSLCELQYSKATSNPVRIVLAVPGTAWQSGATCRTASASPPSTPS